MFCPSCEAEYKEGITRCYDCEVDLVAERPEDVHPKGPLVSVFRSADASLLPVVKSILRGSGIRFSVQGDEAHGLLPFGPVGSGPDGRLLGAHVLVAADSAEAARAVLADLAGQEDDADAHGE